MTIYDCDILKSDGSAISMSEYKGKVLLIVNTATGCGFTPQYEGLQNLYVKYKDEGFEILDFPCNQFLGQAPGTNEEIHTFCKGRFGITFPQFAKIDVNGKNASPLYQFLKSQAKGKLGSAIKWNFTKFLISKDGEVLARFAPTDTPESLDKHIADALHKTGE